MYKSPIDLIVGRMSVQLEGEICRAVQNVGVDVDKDELLKALQYDRGQYQKGYNDRDTEIVRCKDCKFSKPDCESARWCEMLDCIRDDNWFCADGKLKE